MALSVAELAGETEEAYLVRQLAEIAEDLAELRTLLRQGGSVTTAITAMRRQERETRAALDVLRASKGDRISPAERMERARHLSTAAPDMLLEVYVVEWLRRRRVPVSAVAALVEGRE